MSKVCEIMIVQGIPVINLKRAELYRYHLKSPDHEHDVSDFMKSNDEIEYRFLGKVCAKLQIRG